jgi:N-acetylmuramoyl-L-alanine amidase
MAIVGDFVEGLAKKTLVHTGAAQSPTLIVIHYSVTNTVADCVAALNSRKLSYHILIEKDGTAFQTRPFTLTAQHPGLSNWKATSGVTLSASVVKGSIGICLMNMGFDTARVPAANVAAGKLIYNPDDPSMQRWEKFPAAQVARCREIVRELVATYPIREVVGHHDIAIMGKFDPGPLFDLNALDALANGPKPLGFSTAVRSSDGFLNLRAGPSSGAAVIRKLPTGAPVHIRTIAYSGKKSQCIDPTTGNRARYLTPWASVDVDGSNRHAGFVHMSGLAATPLAASLAARL